MKDIKNELDLINFLAKSDVSKYSPFKYFVLVFNLTPDGLTFYTDIESDDPKKVSSRSTRMDPGLIYCVNDFERSEMTFNGLILYSNIDTSTRRLIDFVDKRAKFSSITHHSIKRDIQ